MVTTRSNSNQTRYSYPIKHPPPPDPPNSYSHDDDSDDGLSGEDDFSHHDSSRSIDDHFAFFKSSSSSNIAAVMKEIVQSDDAINDDEVEDVVAAIQSSQHQDGDGAFCDESDGYSDVEVVDVDESDKNTPSQSQRSPSSSHISSSAKHVATSWFKRMVQAFPFHFDNTSPGKDIEDFERVAAENDESIKKLDEVFQRVTEKQPDYGSDGGGKCSSVKECMEIDDGGGKCSSVKECMEIDRRIDVGAIYSQFLLDNRYSFDHTPSPWPDLSDEAKSIISDTIQLASSGASEISCDIQQRGNDMFYIEWLQDVLCELFSSISKKRGKGSIVSVSDSLSAPPPLSPTHHSPTPSNNTKELFYSFVPHFFDSFDDVFLKNDVTPDGHCGWYSLIGGMIHLGNRSERHRLMWQQMGLWDHLEVSLRGMLYLRFELFQFLKHVERERLFESAETCPIIYWDGTVGDRHSQYKGKHLRAIMHRVYDEEFFSTYDGGPVPSSRWVSAREMVPLMSLWLRTHIVEYIQEPTEGASKKRGDWSYHTLMAYYRGDIDKCMSKMFHHQIASPFLESIMLYYQPVHFNWCELLDGVKTTEVFTSRERLNSAIVRPAGYCDEDLTTPSGTDNAATTKASSSPSTLLPL